MSEATQKAKETETALAMQQPEDPAVRAALARVEADTKLFELAQRKAQVYAQSTLVPERYRNNVGNVLIAENMANRMGADTLMVMQNLYVVHGTPGWSAQFLIGTFNSNGRFSAIKYRFKGEAFSPEWACQAYCTEYATNEQIEGTWITYAMATAEGWVNKNGSKWKTMPEQMFRYRAATFLIRATAPEIGLGLLTKEELEDMPQHSINASQQPPQIAGNAAVLEQLGIAAPSEPEQTETVIDGEVVDPQPADGTDGVGETDNDQSDKPELTEEERLENLRVNAKALYEESNKGKRTAIDKWLGTGRGIADLDAGQIDEFFAQFA